MNDRAQILITAIDQTKAAFARVKGNLENLSVAAGKVNGVLASRVMEVNADFFVARVIPASTRADEKEWKLWVEAFSQ